MNVIEVDDVSKAYGDVQALDGLNLSVEQGTTLGVFGTNGAGKTTLFKLLVGLNRPDDGSVSVAGADPTGGTTVRERVRYLPEHAGFPPSLTGREILRFHARMRSVPREDRSHHVERILHTVGLADAADRRVGGYSNGMNRRLGLGTALVGEPAVLILDEPTAGLDPDGIRAFHEVVESLAAETDVTIVFSSHALGEIQRLCSEAVIIADGQVATAGPVEELRRAAADEVTVSLSLTSEAAASDVAGMLRDYEGASSVSRGGVDLTVTTAPTDAYDLLTAVGDKYDIDRFEVREPGLEAAFHEVVGAADGDERTGSDSTAAAAAEDSGGEPA
ncbi:ABC transporter ATP-binding protein [Haloarcula taiwanensis]|uniref:ABC transporter ATP-binding protein n=1 Tax=Haloarcula taiwanensis TaxID=1932004 RepID=A0A2H4ZX79_9EURY|nr:MULTISPECIES: ABC transporter ATP-binding protein [Haloarcula]AUG47101.1 ABC transporter ATP-binding protein [Haloarcula taiwanensis]RLM33346.1 ABC transporter ATP-binding protein [Haloarcula sp. Atlit-120R]RLM42254.1 ABC transporter ATP-binding protein [Haloarcula sp. Atlit-47R]